MPLFMKEIDAPTTYIPVLEVDESSSSTLIKPAKMGIFFNLLQFKS